MNLLEWSLSVSLLIAVIWVIRALTVKRLPKTTFLLLWGVAIFRLLIPFSLPSRFSIYNAFLHFSAKTDAGTFSTEIAATGGIPFFTGIWLAGGLLCLLFFLVSYRRCRRKFQCSLPADCVFAKVWLSRRKLKRDVRVRVSDQISSPLTFGLLRPVILLPKNTDWDDEAGLGCVLTHELIHIRRFDALWKLLLAAVLCLHWFNPLVWLLCSSANRDLELSCDEQVVRILGEKEKAFYARVLIAMEEKKAGFVPLCSYFCKNATEERILAIMNMKKNTAAGCALAAALIASTTAVFATTPSTTAAIPASRVVPASSSAEDMTKLVKVVSVIGDDGQPIPLDGTGKYTLQDGTQVTVVPATNVTLQNAGDSRYSFTVQGSAAPAKGEYTVIVEESKK